MAEGIVSIIDWVEIIIIKVCQCRVIRGNREIEEMLGGKERIDDCHEVGVGVEVGRVRGVDLAKDRSVGVQGDGVRDANHQNTQAQNIGAPEAQKRAKRIENEAEIKGKRAEIDRDHGHGHGRGHDRDLKVIDRGVGRAEEVNLGADRERDRDQEGGQRHDHDHAHAQDRIAETVGNQNHDHDHGQQSQKLKK